MAAAYVNRNKNLPKPSNKHVQYNLNLSETSSSSSNSDDTFSNTSSRKRVGSKRGSLSSFSDTSSRKRSKQIRSLNNEAEDDDVPSSEFSDTSSRRSKKNVSHWVRQTASENNNTHQASNTNNTRRVKTITTDHKSAAKIARNSIKNPRKPSNKGGFGKFKSTKQKLTNAIPDIENNKFIQDGICVTNAGMLACKHALNKYKYTATKILYNKLSLNHITNIAITYEMLAKSTACSVKKFINTVVRYVYDNFETESLFPKNAINFINSYKFAIKNIDACSGDKNILDIIDDIYSDKDVSSFKISVPLSKLFDRYTGTPFRATELLEKIEHIKERYVYPFEVYAYVESNTNDIPQRKNARLTNWTELEFDKLVDYFNSDDDE